jgi:hypothetical protein
MIVLQDAIQPSMAGAVKRDKFAGSAAGFPAEGEIRAEASPLLQRRQTPQTVSSAEFNTEEPPRDSSSAFMVTVHVFPCP